MQHRHTAGVVDVSVIVIVYNDEERLENAVRSVTRQTLANLEVIIADDASTDGTPEVARRLAAEDARVRYLPRETNSGGCGAPRNLGVEQARGRYVMFLDSDDRYEMHACKNLLEAIEAADADFAMGVCVREDMDTGVKRRWFPGIFEQRRVISGLPASPELIQDVLSVNKLYRKDFLAANDLSFPEDVHFEDQLFSFRAYVHAKRIAVIPENVYYWRIYPSHEKLSITRQRHEIRNLQHRITVHRRIDEFISARENSEELARIKDVKFLTDDLRLYLADMGDGDPEFSMRVLDEVQEYLRTIPLSRFELLPPALRAGYAMALRRDLEGVRECMLMDRRNVLKGRISEVEGRWWWSQSSAVPGPSPAFDLDAPENVLADITGSTLPEMPVTAYRLPHEARALDVTPDGVRIEGRTFDGLGRLSQDGDWSFDLVFRRRRLGDVAKERVTILDHSDGMIEWSVNLPLDARALALDNRTRWDLSIDLVFRGGTWRSDLRWDMQESATAPIRTPAARLLAEHVRFYRSMAGNTAIRVGERPHVRGRVMRRLNRRFLPWFERRVVRPTRRRERRLRVRVVYPLMRRFPLRDDLVVFEAQLGRAYGESPKYVYEELMRRREDLRAVWALPRGSQAPGPRTSVVERDSYGYLWALARARYLVDDQTFPRYVIKRPGQRYMQTWHGIPLKRMGLDIGDPAVVDRQRIGHDRGVAAWDYLIVPSPYFEQVFVPAFGFTGNMVRYGTPRNDPLAVGSVDREEVLKRFDIRPDKKVMLFAPTFRDGNRGRRNAVPFPFDIVALTKSLPSDWFILVRAHYLNRFDVPGSVGSRVLDASGVEDINELYAAADVLVTDFSSSMFDFATTGKPIVYYISDYETYTMTRGTYFDLRSEAPGPIVDTTQGLAEAVVDASLAEGPSLAYKQFVDRYCGVEDGFASQRAVNALLNVDEEAGS